MTTLSETERQKIAGAYIKEKPFDIANVLTLHYGKISEENGCNIGISLTSQHGSVYRMHISYHSEDEKEQLEDEYFITLNFLQPRNNLDRMLMDALQLYKHQKIEYAQINDIKSIYNAVVEKYKGPANKCFAKNGFYKTDQGDFFVITIGTQIEITLTKIVGEFFYNSVES